MRRVYVSTIFRVQERGETVESGNLYALDWDSPDKVMSCTEVRVPPTEEYKHAGRSFGCRGITWYRDRICVASSTDRLHFINPDTLEIEEIVHFPEFGYIHQVRAYEDKLYVCNTLYDQVCVVEGARLVDTFDLAKHKDQIQGLRGPGSFGSNRWGKDALHFNSITWDPKNGDEYHLYMGAFMIFNYTKGEVVIYDPDLLSSPHDLEFIGPDLLAFSNSLDRSVLSYNISSRELRVLNKIQHPSNIDVAEHAMHGFTRGIASHKNDLFLCHSPATVEHFYFHNTTKFWPEDKVVLSEDPDENVYDILLDPRDWTNND